MTYKFEKLEVWEMALDYTDLIYKIADQLPSAENYNLKSQITRAATSVALNIAEGSTSQSDPEQVRFIGFAIRSLVESVACMHLIQRRTYLSEIEILREAYRTSEKLFAKLQAFRKKLKPEGLHEVRDDYLVDSALPL